MKILIPYLTIPARCEEALNFYLDCFGGQFTFVQRYSETDYPVTMAFKNKIAHAEFIADGIHFFASDGFEGDAIVTGSNIGLTVNFDTMEERLTVFNKLTIGGVVTMDISATTVNSTLGALIDQFGIHWYLNHDNDA